MDSRERTCSVCGAQVPEEAESCPSCGSWFEGGAEGDQAPALIETTTASQEAGEAATEKDESAIAIGATHSILVEKTFPAVIPEAPNEQQGLPLEEPPTPGESKKHADRRKKRVDTPTPENPIIAEETVVSPDEELPSTIKKTVEETVIPHPVVLSPESRVAVSHEGDARTGQAVRRKSRSHRLVLTCGVLFIIVGLGLFALLHANDYIPITQAKITVAQTAPVQSYQAQITPDLITPSEITKINSSPTQTNATGQTLEGCTTGNMRIRAKPNDDKATLTVGWLVKDTCLIFDGRDQLGVWLHIAPGQSASEGWVVLKYIDLEGDIVSLPVLEAESTTSP